MSSSDSSATELLEALDVAQTGLRDLEKAVEGNTQGAWGV